MTLTTIFIVWPALLGLATGLGILFVYVFWAERKSYSPTVWVGLVILFVVIVIRVCSLILGGLLALFVLNVISATPGKLISYIGLFFGAVIGSYAAVILGQLVSNLARLSAGQKARKIRWLRQEQRHRERPH